MPFPPQPYQRIDKYKIRSLRIKTGFTQQQIGEALGVSQTTIKRFENSPNHIPSVELVMRYCEYFKVPFIELLLKEERKRVVKIQVDFMLQHDIIDYGTGQAYLNFYS